MKKIKISVLDDSNLVLERIKRVFTVEDGFDCYCTDSWVDIKDDVFSKTPPDLLILDLKMPSIDGVAVGKAIKRRMDLPIIIFSSENVGTISKAVTDVGADRGLSKSDSDYALKTAVKGVLSKRGKL